MVEFLQIKWKKQILTPFLSTHSSRYELYKRKAIQLQMLPGEPVKLLCVCVFSLLYTWREVESSQRTVVLRTKCAQGII